MITNILIKWLILLLKKLENLRQYEAIKISFTTTNTGKNLDFVIAISDGHSDPKVRRVRLNGGQVYSGDVMVIPKAILTL